MPAIRVAADHRRFDDQLLPLPWRAQRAVHDRHVLLLLWALRCGFGACGCIGLVAGGLDARETGEEIVHRRGDRRVRVAERAPSGTCERDRYSAKRAADSRSTAQREHSQERAAGRMGAAGAAIEPGRDARAREGVLEQADVVARRSHQHGHLVEAARPPPLRRRMRRAISTHSRPSPGAENRRTSPAGVRFGGWLVAKSIPLQRREVGLPGGFEDVRIDARRFEVPERCQIAERHRDEDLWRGLDQLAHQPELDGRIHRHVEQEQRAARGTRRRTPRPPRTASRDRWPMRRRTGPRIASSSRARSGPPSGKACKAAVPTRASSSSCRVRARARGKPGVPATGPKYSELVISTGFERGARRHRFAADERHRRDAARRQDRRRQPCRELRQAEAMQADRPAARGRDGAGQVVGGATRGRDDQRHHGPPRARRPSARASVKRAAASEASMKRREWM